MKTMKEFDAEQRQKELELKIKLAEIQARSNMELDVGVQTTDRTTLTFEYLLVTDLVLVMLRPDCQNLMRQMLTSI